METIADTVIKHSKEDISSTHQIFDLTNTKFNREYFELANLYWGALKLIKKYEDDNNRIKQ